MKKILLSFIGLTILCILFGCKAKETWEDNSQTFSHEFGEMFGKKGSIGIVGSKTMINNNQKWMWHFWGTEEISYKEWDVKAFKEGDEKAINPIVSKDEILYPRGEEINGHARTKMYFPSPGLWKLKVYIDGEFFDEIIVNIENTKG